MSDVLILTQSGSRGFLVDEDGQVLAELHGIRTGNADSRLHAETGRRLCPRGRWSATERGCLARAVAPREA